MKDNEPLGIYEELRAKAKPVERIQQERKRMLQVATWNGATVPVDNPFRERQLKKLPEGTNGYYRRYPDQPRRGRKVHEDAGLNITVAQVIKAVCEETELTHGEMMNHRRKRKWSWPRHIAWWAIDHYCPQYSLKEVAYLFACDHTSVMYGIERTGERLFDNDTWTRTIVANVHQRLMTIVECS